MNRAFITRLKKKPKATRIEFAFFTALATTGFIGVIWMALLPFRLDGVQNNDVELANERSAFGSFFDSAKLNLGQLIGADIGSSTEEEKVHPGESVSGVYKEGTPEGALKQQGYYDTNEENIPIPVNRREVRIRTSSRDQ